MLGMPVPAVTGGCRKTVRIHGHTRKSVGIALILRLDNTSDMTKQFLPLFCFVLLIGVGCSSDPEPTDPEPVEKAYTMYSFERKSSSCATDSNRCAVFKAEFPLLRSEMAGPNTANTINATVRKEVVSASGLVNPDEGPTVQSLEDQCMRFFNDYQEYLNYGNMSAMPWSMETMGKVIHQSPDIWNVALENYQFTGGAHPNTHTVYLNFDLDSGKLLHWSDVLADSLGFVHLAEAAFRKVWDISEEVNLEEAGFFWGEAFHPPANFSLEEEGLRLYYNTYEIAPYALGPTDYILPYDQLQDVLKPEYRSKR